jgi:hypothetical protein
MQRPFGGLGLGGAIRSQGSLTVTPSTSSGQALGYGPHAHMRGPRENLSLTSQANRSLDCSCRSQQLNGYAAAIRRPLERLLWDTEHSADRTMV